MMRWSRTTPTATLLSVIKRSIATPPASKTRPMDFKRSLTIPLPATTRPTVIRRSIATATSPALRTPPLAPMRSLTTPAAPTTRPSVIKRSIVTPSANSIRPLALRPARTSPAVATSVSDISSSVLLARTTPLVSVIFTLLWQVIEQFMSMQATRLAHSPLRVVTRKRLSR